MTPTAAIGILESIFWKPEFRWRPRAIDVLCPIRWAHLMRNEIDNRQTLRTASQWAATGTGHFDAAANRDQRHTLLLRDVAYVIHADVEVISGDAEDAKYRDQFRRRVSRGQHFSHPYLGCREFLANVAEVSDEDQPIQEDLDLGRILTDIRRDERGQMVEASYSIARLAGGRLMIDGMAEVEINALI